MYWKGRSFSNSLIVLMGGFLAFNPISAEAANPNLSELLGNPAGITIASQSPQIQNIDSLESKMAELINEAKKHPYNIKDDLLLQNENGDAYHFSWKDEKLGSTFHFYCIDGLVPTVKLMILKNSANYPSGVPFPLVITEKNDGSGKIDGTPELVQTIRYAAQILDAGGGNSRLVQENVPTLVGYQEYSNLSTRNIINALYQSALLSFNPN